MIKKYICIFMGLVLISIKSYAGISHDLEHWSTVVMVRTNQNNVSYFYLKKYQLSEENEKFFLEGIKIKMENKTPHSRIVAFKFHKNKAPESKSSSISENDADVIEKSLMTFSDGIKALP